MRATGQGKETRLSISKPASLWVFMMLISMGVSREGLARISAGTEVLPMS